MYVLHDYNSRHEQSHLYIVHSSRHKKENQIEEARKESQNKDMNSYQRDGFCFYNLNHNYT